MGRGLGAGLGGIDRIRLSRDERGMKPILDIGCSGWAGSRGARLLLSFSVNSSSGAPSQYKQVLAQFMMGGLDDARRRLAQGGLGIVLAPGPGVAEPESRQQAKPRRFRAAIMDGDPDEHILRPLLGVFHEHVKVAVVVEDAGVEQFVLELFPRPLLGSSRSGPCRETPFGDICRGTSCRSG